MMKQPYGKHKSQTDPTHQVGGQNNYQNYHPFDFHKMINQGEDSLEEEDSPEEKIPRRRRIPQRRRIPWRRRISRRRRSATWRTTRRRLGTATATHATSPSREVSGRTSYDL